MLMRVLTGIVAAGVVIAGMTLWRTVGIRRVRWIIAGLAGYGAVAFLHAMLTGITLRTVLSGHGLFQRLPYVLQGAFIGGFIVLPLGWIASIARAGIPRFRKGSLRRNAYQAVALTTCVAVLVTSIAQPAGPSSPEARRSAPLSPAERSTQLDRSLRAIADVERKSPRDRWDPDYVVNTVGRDPQQLFSWAQENTYWIPYRGVLRGPVGVLMDGQGNSLDRALLLATLLQKAGHNVRLARGELTREDATDHLLTSLVSERAVDFTVPNETDTALEPDVRTAAAKYNLDGAAIERIVQEQAQAVKRISAELDARVADQTARLLRSARPSDVGDDWLKRFETSVEALRDHWWVQRQDGQTWVDLDLLAAAGTSLLAAKETLAIKDVAADQYHEIAIRVISEQWSAGTLRERKALEHVLRPADLIGQPIVLQFLPIDWLADSAPQVQSKLGLRATVLDQHEWSVGLLVGRNLVASTTLGDSGGDEAGAPAKGGEMGGLGAALANSLGNRGANMPGKAKNMALSAVWLEYEIRVPGEKPRTIRRTVFDLLGPAARSATASPTLTLDDAKKLTRALSLTMKTEILPIVCQFSPQFVAHLTSESLAGDKDLLLDIASDDFSPRAEKTKQQLANAPPPVTPLMALAFSRLEWSGSADHIFLDRPNIVTRHRSFVNAGNEIALQDAIDIVANEVAVDLTVRDAFAIRLQQGVRDTNGEALLAAGAATGNAGEAFADSRDWLTVTPGDRSLLDTLTFSDDIRRRMAQDLDAGDVVVAPRAPVERRNEHFTGWWRIDPNRGDALGVGANGWGQSMVERGHLTNLAVTFSRSFLFEYGLCQSFPLAVNSLRVINEELFGGWHPSWTGPSAKSKDPLEVADENMHMCLVQAIAAGFIATLPLLLITLKYSRAGRALALARRARGVPHSPRTPPRGPCLALGPLPHGAPLAVLVIPPFAALFFMGSCDPFGKVSPGNRGLLDGPKGGGPEGGGPKGGGPKGAGPDKPNPGRGPSGTEVDPDTPFKLGKTEPGRGTRGNPGGTQGPPTLEEVQAAEAEADKANRAAIDAIGESARYNDAARGHDIDPQKLQDLRDTATALNKAATQASDRAAGLKQLHDFFGPGSGGSGGGSQGAAGAAGAINALKGGS